MAPLRLYSKSGVMEDWKCPRSRYWRYEYGGRGVTTGTTHLELYLGQCLHDGLAAIAMMQQNGVPTSIDEIASAANQQMITSLMENAAGLQEELDFANEQGALVEGLLRGFHRHVWPRLMAQYPTIVLVEKEMIFKHGNFGFMAKPDLVVRDKEGALHYCEYKSTSSKKEGWINSFNTAIQLHSTIKAIEAALGEAVVSVNVVGLFKGFISYNRQNSVFCYCYQRNGNPPFSETERLYEYKAGFKRQPTWELEGGVKKWVEEMPEAILGDQFPMCPPIYIKEDLIADFFAQRNVRETEIVMALQMMETASEEDRELILNGSFPQIFEACHPFFGKPCQFNKLCFGPKGVDPLDVGYEWRDQEHLAGFREIADAQEG